MTLFSWFDSTLQVKHPYKKMELLKDNKDTVSSRMNTNMWPMAKVRDSLLIHQKHIGKKVEEHSNVDSDAISYMEKNA